MTELEIRERYIEVANRYVGMEQYSVQHREILDAYNGYVPLPRGYKVTARDSYCMTFCSAIAIMTGMDDIFPIECGVGEAQKKAVSMGIWNEDDAYIPEPGDLVLFDWNDTGSGDNKGWPTHVAIVTGVDIDDELIHLINPNDSEHGVSEWSIPIDGKNIRGFIMPDYAALAEPDYPIGTVTTELYLRVAPFKIAPKCKIELQDGRGIRNTLYKGEKVLIIGEYNGWYQIRCIGLKYVWEPWCSAKYVEKKAGG